jgi:hypothetical protein
LRTFADFFFFVLFLTVFGNSLIEYPAALGNSFVTALLADRKND